MPINIVDDRARTQRGEHLFQLTQEFSSVPSYTYNRDVDFGPAHNIPDAEMSQVCIKTGITAPRHMMTLSEEGWVLNELYKPFKEEVDWQQYL